MSVVEFQEVNKIYPDGGHAVKDLNLRIDDGDLMVLVGPSGCGKSTILRLLAGLEDVTSGEVLIDGKMVNDVPPQQRDVAMVFQEYALYPHMTVRRNLEFPLKMRKLSQSQITARVEQAAELLGLSDLMDRRPKQLSGGQRQRAAMGRAIVRDPSVFLMDEPLSNLDAKLRVQIRSEIASLQERMGTTTIYVTHDQIEAMTLGDQVAVMNNGVLQQVASPRYLYDRPDNIFVAGFIGSPGMNLIESLLVCGADGKYEMDILGQKIHISDTAFEEFSKLKDQVNKKIIIGFRPEAVSYDTSISGECVVRLRVSGLESTGHETLVYFSNSTSSKPAFMPSSATDIGRTDNIVARLPGDVMIQSGTEALLSIDVNKLYYFDEKGMALY